MGTIPFPNIPEAAGEIAQAPANAFAQGVGIRGAQQEQQERSLQMEQQRRQLADQKATTDAFLNWDHKDPNELAISVVTRGGSATAAQAIQQHYLGLRKTASDIAKQDADTGSTVLKSKIERHNQTLGQLTSLDDVPDAELAQQITQHGQQLAQSDDPEERDAAQHILALAQTPPQQARQKLKVIEHGLMGEKEIFEQQQKSAEQSTKQQEANAKDWEKFPEMGVMVNARTGEQKSVTGGLFMPPAMMESKYVALQQRKNSGQPLDPSDAAWVKAYEKYKTLVPQFNLNQNLTGGGMIPGAGQPGGQGGAPPTVENIPSSIAGRVKAIIDYRAPLPPQGRGNATNSAISYWVNQLDPQHDETTFPARNKLMTSFTSGKESQQINAINTAMGHVGVLGDAIDALNNTNVPALNAIANKLGVAIGNTPAATFKTIVHRVGPELAAAYIQGGGGEAERGTTADDFSADKGTDQLKSNVGITAKLLRSKIGSLENQYKNTMKRDDFNERFITPEAKATLDTWSPKKSGAAAATKTYQGHTYEQQSDGSWKLQP